eukprot:TRINITY_DN1631_c0_g1_i2.p1 TRINITY_DN1631_c0_g1~~TRINITY_DN1631_c0_g1_i2.p1  ORF type:complete len:289 (+),score=80.89 TRINITY_DN1631_c0_g1_i2:28-894(+)
MDVQHLCALLSTLGLLLLCVLLGVGCRFRAFVGFPGYLTLIAAVADCFFSLNFILYSATDAALACVPMGIYGQICQSTAIMWHTAWAFHVVVQLLQVSASARALELTYHVLLWLYLAGSATAFGLVADIGPVNDGPCWILLGRSLANDLVFFLVPVFLCLAVTFLSAAVCIVQLARGYYAEHTLLRKSLLHHVLYNVAFLASWGTAFVATLLDAADLAAFATVLPTPLLVAVRLCGPGIPTRKLFQRRPEGMMMFDQVMRMQLPVEAHISPLLPSVQSGSFAYSLREY